MRANDGIDLAIMPGEIHALLGENGAGKSTLVKIIYGVVSPDSGTIVWEGRAVAIPDPNAARRLGIGMVFQHFSLFESLTVAENIALGLGDRHAPAALAPRIRAVAERYGLAVDPTRHVHHLSVGERQRVEIVRCLLQEPKLLILDEPTSVLTPQEADGLFAMLRRLADEGCSVLYISHKLEEIAALCHHATVLRAGRVIGECDPTQTSPRKMAEMMVGAAMHRAASRPSGAARRDAARRRWPHPAARRAVRHGAARHPPGFGCGRDPRHRRASRGTVRRSCWRRCRASGGSPMTETIRLAGRPVGTLGAAARRRRGLAFIPEERLGRGAVAEMSLAENGLLTAYGRLARAGLIAWAGSTASLPTLSPGIASLRPASTPRGAACRAATCRNSSSGGRSASSQACCSPRTRPGAWMSAPPSRSGRR